MKKRQFSSEMKSKIILELLKEEKTISEIAGTYEISVNQLYNWRKEFNDNISRIFGETKTERDYKNKEKELLAREQNLMSKIGELTVENDWLKKKSAEKFG